MTVISFKTFLKVVAFSAKKFSEHHPVRLAGTLAFFTIFSLVPILLILINVLGFLLGEERITRNLYQFLHELLGHQTTLYIEGLIETYVTIERTTSETIFSYTIFIFASSTFFILIQNSLNSLWNVKPKPGRNWLKFIIDRLLSFAMILVIGVFFIISLVSESLTAAIRGYIREIFPEFMLTVILILSFVFSFLLLSFIFTSLYKFLGDVRIRWRVAFSAAVFTTFLFILGKYLIAIGLRYSGIGTLYGTAGSMVIILMWVFYSALIFFFGASFALHLGNAIGKPIKPSNNAVRIMTSEIEIDTKDN